MELLLNTQRKIDYDQARENTFGDNNSLKEKLAIGLINTDDFKKLNLTANERVKLTSKYGNVIVSIKKDENIPQNTIVMPVGIWSNQITGIENGLLFTKNVEVSIEATSEPISTITELISKIKSSS